MKASSNPTQKDLSARTQRPGRRRAAWVLVAGLASLFSASVCCWVATQNRTSPVDETAIFVGVTYGCRTLPRTAEGGGPMHWVRADLTAPGIGLYVTPVDPDLETAGYQYRLRRVRTVARDEHLAVAVNGALFTKEASPGYWPGARARGVETVVAAGRVSHAWEHTYLMWFEPDLTPHLERTKPPSDAVLARAYWGIGGQAVGLQSGRVRDGAGRDPNARTAVGVDPAKRLLVLAVFESASPRLALEELAALGAREGMLLDGGGSTGMVIGSGAASVRPGTVLGGLRPVATHFGIRADRLHE